jgi:hypothetical protein
MAQKFVKFEEAIEKLGISGDQLNDLRELGQLRAYRDGPSWKFRADEIEKMSEEGVPDPPPPSDIGLVADEELVAAEPLELEDDDELTLEPEDDDTKISKSSPMLQAEDESALEGDLGDTDTLSSGSELELDLDDTVTAGGSGLVLDDVDQPSDISDSILLSEEELGESVGSNASKIVGKGDLESEDADLELALDDDIHGEESDVKLSNTGASDVLSSKIAGSGVLDSEEAGSGGGGSAFEDLEELDKVRGASEPPTSETKDSDLMLDDESELADENNMGSTDVPLLDSKEEPELVDDGSGSEIELSGDDDLVIGDASGSDITLESGDSGINLISPADSGLALDDIPLDIGGSAILSSLSLGGDSDPEISLLGDSQVGADEPAALQTDDDFQLTPLSEAGQEAEGDSSSQVIALDAGIEELAEGRLQQFEDVDLTEDVGDAVVLSEDFGAAPAGDMGVEFAPAPMAGAAAIEMPYSTFNILALSSVTVLLCLVGVMMLDMVWNIWSWQEPYLVSSSLLDALMGIFGMN